MDKIAPLLQAVASLGWVVFAFVTLFVFKHEIKHALYRLRKGKIMGQEFELEEELAGLQTSTAALVSEVQAVPMDNPPALGARHAEDFELEESRILRHAASSPKVALMMLSAELDKQALHGLATRGLLRGRRTVPLSDALSELRQYGFPTVLEGSLELFRSARNKIIHGMDATDDDALRAIDSGMIILKALSGLPRETYIVDHPGVVVFSDSNCTSPIPDAKGLILGVTSPGGVITRKAIFPTTKTHFEKGKQVAWEWNNGKQWRGAWYKDPDSGQIKPAWGGSVEFIGRHLDDIQGSTDPVS